MPRSFLRELKRRKVYRVAVAYAIVGWLLIQVATQVFPYFRIPDWTVRVLVLLVLAGFPIALVMAWAFDATPHGIVRTETQGQPVLRRSRRGTITVGTIGVLIAIIAGLGYWTWHREPAPRTPTVASTAGSPDARHNPGPAIPDSTAAPASSGLRGAGAQVAPIPAKSVAVLPFENLSTDKGNAYFADGMQDLILTKLADIGDLKVISRTSTMQYGSHPENLKLVGKQLGVASILEGSVQKAGNQVLINVQLIDAKTDNHLWAESYTRTLDNIFGVEGEVADKVANALNAKLTHAESASVASIPTQNPAAYDAYLRGLVIEKNLDSSKSKHPLRDAEGFYAKAVKLDRTFALAWAHLSYIKTLLYSRFIDRSPAFLAQAKQAVDTALRLQPNLGEGYLVLAQYYYLAVRDLDAAIPPLNKARTLLPNNAEALVALSDVEERQGKWQEANAHLRQAAVLEPRTVGWLLDLAGNDDGMRQFAKAQAILDRALLLAPKDKAITAFKATVWQDQGNIDEAQKLLDTLPATAAHRVRLRQVLFKRDFDGAIAIAKGAIAQPDQDDLGRTLWRAELAGVFDMAGHKDEAKAAAKPLIGQLESFRKSPADDVLLSRFLAEVYAILGDKDAALREARRNVVVHSTCSVCKPDAVAELAQLEARFGDLDAAMAVVPHLLVVPNGYTVAEMRLNPVWDPLRKDPRFEALLKKYANTAPASSASAADTAKAHAATGSTTSTNGNR